MNSTPIPYRSLLALFLFQLLLCACSRAPQLPPIPPDGVVLAFGDSITFGTGAGPGESYPEVLERLINRKVINAGIPGETSASGSPRLTRMLAEERPALLILCHGGNDLLQRLDPGSIAENLASMIMSARENGISVVLVGVPSPDLSLDPPPFYEKLAKEFDIPYDGDILPLILGKGSLKSDYIHPNAAGYRQLAGSLAKMLKKAGAV